jgi:hypothetical protein
MTHPAPEGAKAVDWAAAAQRELHRKLELERALRAIVAHWNEHGPEYGFDELVGRANSILETK